MKSSKISTNDCRQDEKAPLQIENKPSTIPKRRSAIFAHSFIWQWSIYQTMLDIIIEFLVKLNYYILFLDMSCLNGMDGATRIQSFLWTKTSSLNSAASGLQI